MPLITGPKINKGRISPAPTLLTSKAGFRIYALTFSWELKYQWQETICLNLVKLILKTRC